MQVVLVGAGGRLIPCWEAEHVVLALVEWPARETGLAFDDCE